MVSTEKEYTFLGWVMLMFGISAKPTAVRQVCRRCGETIERTTQIAERDRGHSYD